MNYHLLIGIALLVVSSATAQEAPLDYKKLSDAERLQAAQKIAQTTIMVDGHVDLPYRMKVGGFTLQREILDVSVRTPDGNFDYPRAKEGDSMPPLCQFTFLQATRLFQVLPKHLQIP